MRSSRDFVAVTLSVQRASHSLYGRVLRRGRAERRLSSAANPARRVIAAARRDCASKLAIGPFRDLSPGGSFCAPHGRSTVPRARGQLRCAARLPALCPSLHSVRRGGLAQLPHPCELDLGGDAHRESWRRRAISPKAPWG